MINSFVKFQLRIRPPLFPGCFVIHCPEDIISPRNDLSVLLSREERERKRKKRGEREGKKRLEGNLHIYPGWFGFDANFCSIFSITSLSVKRSCSVNPQARIGKWWRVATWRVAYGMAGGSLFKTPMRFLFNPWIPVREFYRKPAMPEPTFHPMSPGSWSKQSNKE